MIPSCYALAIQHAQAGVIPICIPAKGTVAVCGFDVDPCALDFIRQMPQDDYQEMLVTFAVRAHEHVGVA